MTIGQRGSGAPISTGSSSFGTNPNATKEARDIFTRWKSAKNKRSNWEWQWQDVLKYLVPQKDFVTRQRSIQGEQLNPNVYDTTARIANQTMASGFQGNLTNPATRWFNLRLQKPELNEQKEVKLWLSEVQNIMFDVFSSSNFDEQIHECYIDLGSAGTSVLFATEDPKDIIRFRCMHVSEISIGEDHNERVNEVYRQYSLTAIQAFQKWGKKAPKEVHEKIEKKKFDDPVQFLHAVFPRAFRVAGSNTSNNLPIASVHMALASQEVVQQGGFHEMPFMVTRFFKVSGDPYGYSPGIVMLPDIKMLNIVTKTIIRAAQKIVDPPLILPHDGFLLPLNTIPAGINYRISGNPNDRIEPLQTGANIPVGREEQADLRMAINKAYFNDLFLTLADRRNMTATEVVERVQEKMLMLGPVLGRLQSEMLDPIIERTFNILLRNGLLPPAPDFLDGEDFTVEYISPLANAQRGARVTSITNLLQFAGAIAPLVPEVIDKINTDKSIDQAADVFGTNPNLVRSAEEVEQIRAQRAEAQQQLAQQEAIANAAQVAKTGSEAERNLAEANAKEQEANA
jgi:hypothetical protein